MLSLIVSYYYDSILGSPDCQNHAKNEIESILQSHAMSGSGGGGGGGDQYGGQGQYGGGGQYNQQQSYGQQYGQQQNYQSPNAYPQYPNSYNPNDPSMAPQQGEGAMPGLVRAGVGAAKMVPILGNVLNGLDTLRDAGRVVKNLFTGHPMKALKASADMLFHGVGTVIPQVGGAYDMAQGLVRAAAAQPSIPAWAQQAYQPDPWSSLPPYNPSYGPDITDQAIRSIGALREPAIPGPDASPQELAQYEKDSKRYDRAMELYSSIIKKRDELQMSLIRKM